MVIGLSQALVSAGELLATQQWLRHFGIGSSLLAHPAGTVLRRAILILRQDVC